jgi:putative transposase
MNRTLMQRLKGLPGTTGNSTVGRKARKSADRAALSLKEFEHWLTVEVAQRYHNTSHRSLMGATPASAWTTLAQTHPPDCCHPDQMRPCGFWSDSCPWPRARSKATG